MCQKKNPNIKQKLNLYMKMCEQKGNTRTLKISVQVILKINVKMIIAL